MYRERIKRRDMRLKKRQKSDLKFSEPEANESSALVNAPRGEWHQHLHQAHNIRAKTP